jgi:hypothetical protein
VDPYGSSMRRVLVVTGWGVLGAVVAGALIVGAFAVAGTRLTQPASAVRIVPGSPLRPTTSDHHETEPTPTADGAPTSVPSPADDSSPVATGVVRSPTVPVPSPSEDGGAERGDD